jgi:hypothetical protein
MKLRIAVIAVLCTGLCCSASMPGNQAYTQENQTSATNRPVVMPQITVFNPMGTPPPITLKPQAPRPDTLDAKTIYFLNTGYIGTDRLMAVMMDWFRANHPKTNIVYKDFAGGVALDSINQALWKEIEEKGDAAIVGLGH